MELIFQDLLGINKVQFPYNGFLSLTEYIHELTRFYKVPFSADHTEYEKPTATYTCTFGGRCSANYFKTNTGCESILVFAKYFIDENTVLFTLIYHVLFCDIITHSIFIL